MTGAERHGGGRMTMVQSVPAEGVAVPGHSPTKLTYTDYLQFPDDGLRHEIIEGEHYVTPSPAMRHQRISGDLYYFLRGYLERYPVGDLFYAPFDVVLSDINIVVPDLVFILKQRSHLLTEKNLQGAPDLVIEILSPGTRSRDTRLKRDLYERMWVAEYWLVDPERDVIDVCRREGNAFAALVRYEKGRVLATLLLPGLELPLDAVFR